MHDPRYGICPRPIRKPSLRQVVQRITTHQASFACHHSGSHNERGGATPMTYPCQKCGKIWEQPDSDVNCGYASAHCVLCGGGVGLTRTIKKCTRCGKYGETRFCENCGGSLALVNEYLS